ncbi:MAG: TonB-dependent receptor [Cyclobacteriaceae bacterium]|nr:TonB-dependent receptor [Cyclobacteriaceae bacterium]
MMHFNPPLLPKGRKLAFSLWLSVLAISLSPELFGQITVRGKITDESGTGMPGVNVLVKGTAVGTTSDAQGEYSIAVPEGSQRVLVFSFIGYASQEVPVDGRTVIDVQLTPSVEALSEVVVVGYGVQRKTDLTGSLVQVDQKALAEVPVGNIGMALQGRAAGVDIQRTSSRPGANPQIRIRGNRSLGGTNDPLIVLDGIPFAGSINDINPNDIVSINVLKDASATAIYGSRSSNGVILINTKRGKVGAPTLSYDGYVGLNTVLGKYDLMNGEEYARFKDIANTYPYTATEIESMLLGRSTDWQDVMYKNGIMTNHDITVSGGSDETQYSIGAGYFRETTVLPGQAFTRYALRATIDQKVGNRIKIGINTLNNVGITDGENVNPMFQILTLSPLYVPYTETGQINELPAIGSVDEPTRNPLLLYREDLWKQQRRRLRTFNSLYGELKILNDLKYRINVGLDYRQDEYGEYLGSNTPFRNGAVNQAAVENGDAWSYTVENLLIYDKTFANKHTVNFTALYSVQEEEGNSSRTTVEGVYADYVQYYNLGLADRIQSATGNYYRWGLLSYMGRLNYNYADRYLLTVTYRADGSSRLAEGNKWFNYPAFALGWNVHNESFMSNVPVLSTLKLRFGYGLTSNQAINPYSSLGNLSRIPYNFGSTGTFGFLVNSLPNKNLTWEFTRTANIGFDFGLFTNRITGTVELYQQKTSDILQNRQLPVTAGVPGVYAQNIGKTENKGIEVTLGAIVLERPNGFTWSVDANFFLNREKITQLSDPTVTRDIVNGWHVGHPVDVIYDFEKIGIWQTGESGGTPGQIKLRDLNGDNVIDPDNDRKILGYLQPKWQGGITTRIAYKGFDLSVVAFGRYGGMLVSTLYQANIGFPVNSLEGRRNGPRVDYWTPTNPTNKYPKPGMGQVPVGPDQGSTLGYFDATYLKIRSINLGYQIPSSVLRRTGISSLRVYATVQSPFKAFFSEYVKEGGLDPEPTGRGGSVTPGFGAGSNRLTVQPNTPLTRTFIFGFNVRY